jgi:hypothetical protein
VQTLNTYPLLNETAYIKTFFILHDINVILRDWKGSGSSLHGDVIPLNIQWGDDFPLTLCPPGCAFTPHLKFIVKLLSLTFVFPYCTF